MFQVLLLKMVKFANQRQKTVCDPNRITNCMTEELISRIILEAKGLEEAEKVRYKKEKFLYQIRNADIRYYPTRRSIQYYHPMFKHTRFCDKCGNYKTTDIWEGKVIWIERTPTVCKCT